MLSARTEDVGYFEPPAKKEQKVHMTIRVPEGLSNRLDGLVRLWKAMAIARGADPAEVDKSYVVVRLLSVGVDAAFEEVGGFPADEKAWEKTLATVTKKISSAK